MKYADMVGRLCTYNKAIYRIIEWGGPGGHGFYLEAVSSNCRDPWLDISERAIDRTIYGDWHPRFWNSNRQWLIANPMIAVSSPDYSCYSYTLEINSTPPVRFNPSHTS
jgi:hypothetical protein